MSDEIDGSTAPLMEHLIELRQRIIWSIIAFVVSIIAAYLVWQPIFNFLTHPVCNALEARGQSCSLVLIKLQEGFFVSMSIAVFGGIVLSFPIIAFQLWRFVAPGLYKSERGAFLPFLIASPVMFTIGAAFAYFVVLPVAFNFFLGFQQNFTPTGSSEGVKAAAGSGVPAGIVFQGSVQEYLSLTMKFVTAFGLCFQLPVLLTLMGKAEIVSSKGLASVRKYAIVAILTLAAIVTPPDIMSQIILFAAIYPLYEVSIFLIARIEKSREARLRAEGLWVDEDEDEAADDAGLPATGGDQK